MTVPVTLVTKNGADEVCIAGYNDADAMYREIYTELRENMSLDKFVATIESEYSKAWWSKYERGVTEITRQAKQELRRAVGLEPLVPTVTESLANVDSNAEVWQVGDNPIVKRLIKIATDAHVRIDSNGQIAVTPVTPVTGDSSALGGDLASTSNNGAETPRIARNNGYKTIREPVYRPCFSTDEKERFDSLGGLRAIIDAGIKALEQ